MHLGLQQQTYFSQQKNQICSLEIQSMVTKLHTLSGFSNNEEITLLDCTACFPTNCWTLYDF